MSESIGQINQEVYKQFVSSQNSIATWSQQIGIIEVRKTELVRMIEKESETVNNLMKKEAYRLEIPDGQDWHIDKDGAVFLGRAADPEVASTTPQLSGK